jgi:Flp pilus assembly protein TadD
MIANLAEAIDAHRRGEIDAAAAVYQRVLAESPDHPDALHYLGVATLQRGDPARARDLIARAARLRPDDPTILSNLGVAYRALGDKERTIVSCRRAVELAPHSASLHLNFGLALSEASLVDEALSALHEAVRLDPKQTAGHMALAKIHEQMGDFDLAIESLRYVLGVVPRDAGALAGLASMCRGAISEDDRAAIESVLADPALPIEPGVQLRFGLVQVMDARAEFGAAAELANQANAMRLANLQSRGLVYDHGAHRAAVDDVIAAFSPAYFERMAGTGVETDRPVFIVGLPRSGTTLIEQILASHSRVYCAGELTLAGRLLETLRLSIVERHRAGDPDQQVEGTGMEGVAKQYLAELTAVNSTADRVVDKMPDNTMFLGLIATIFPRAKIIQCQRDLRDVALSCWFTDFRDVRWACDTSQITARFAEHNRLMAHWKHVLPAAILDVPYEEVVSHFELWARTIVKWCGLDWEPACLDFHKTRRAVATASVNQVRNPIYHRSVGRWKNYQELLAPLFSAIATATDGTTQGSATD